MKDQEKLEAALFSGAIRYRNAEARAAYLEGACRDDPTLRQRVEQLLEERGESLTAKETEPTPVPVDAWVPLTEKPGDRIGRYKLLQQIGEGGFGVVYLAEQEEPVRRRVALKVIKLGMDTRAVVGRFEAERQALAMMNHPSIAKVLDGGATDSGRPYFVMELVRGSPITEYCDQQKLSTRERLELFTEVCHAIQHAHQKGVIHRDIKPSNILVTVEEERPHPKVIDFGIAKATGARLTDKTVFTAFEQFIGTPAYVSPEQVEMNPTGAGDIDTRSDIYSLGVLLYELLTGKTPFDTRQLLAAGLVEMRRTIRDEDPLRPSTRLTRLTEVELATLASQRRSEVSQLPSQLRGDLDWINMKALEKDRTRRYQTVGALAEDIGRHLNHEPVEAAPPSVTYRLKKLARRNKMAVAVLGALLLGLVLSLWQAYRAESARQVAELSRQEAEGLIAYMLDHQYGKLMQLVRVDLMQEVVEKAKDYFARLPSEETSFESQYNRSLVLDCIGRLAFQASEDGVAESNYLAALEIRERLIEAHPNNVRYLLGKAETLQHLGRFEYDNNRFEKGTRYNEAGRQTLSNLLRMAPSDLEAQALLGRTLLLRGRLRNSGPGGAGVSAEDMLQAQDIFKSLCDQQPEEKRWRADLAECYYDLGRTYVVHSAADDDKAEAELLKAIHLYTNLLSHSSQNLEQRYLLAWSHLRLGEAYLRNPEQSEDGKVHTEQARVIFGELQQQDYFVRRGTENGLRTATLNLVRLYPDDPSRAIAYLRSAVDQTRGSANELQHRELIDLYREVIRSTRAVGQDDLSQELERELNGLLRKSWDDSWSRADPSDVDSLQREVWHYHLLADSYFQLLGLEQESRDQERVGQIHRDLMDVSKKHAQVAFGSSRKRESWLAMVRAKRFNVTGEPAEALKAIDHAISLQPESPRSAWLASKSQFHEALGQPSEAVEARTQMWILIGPSLIGQWDFDAGDLTATVGSPLEYFDRPDGKTQAQTRFGTTAEFDIPDIGGEPARVMRFPKCDRTMGFVMRHGAEPSGGGTYVNQYTLIMDIMWDDQPGAGRQWGAFFQTDEKNQSDAELFARWDNDKAGIGVSSNYDGKTNLVSGQWHRVAIAVDMSEPVITKFIDGVKHSDQHDLRGPPAGLVGRDGRFSLGSELLLFTDQDWETLAGYVNSIQFHNVKLPDLVLESLSGPQARGIPQEYEF